MHDLRTIIAMNAPVNLRTPRLGVVIETQDLMRQLRKRDQQQNRVPADDQVIYGETVTLS